MTWLLDSVKRLIFFAHAYIKFISYNKIFIIFIIQMYYIVYSTCCKFFLNSCWILLKSLLIIKEMQEIFLLKKITISLLIYVRFLHKWIRKLYSVYLFACYHDISFRTINFTMWFQALFFFLLIFCWSLTVLFVNSTLVSMSSKLHFYTEIAVEFDKYFFKY